MRLQKFKTKSILKAKLLQLTYFMEKKVMKCDLHSIIKNLFLARSFLAKTTQLAIHNFFKKNSQCKTSIGILNQIIVQCWAPSVSYRSQGVSTILTKAESQSQNLFFPLFCLPMPRLHVNFQLLIKAPLCKLNILFHLVTQIARFFFNIISIYAELNVAKSKHPPCWGRTYFKVDQTIFSLFS